MGQTNECFCMRFSVDDYIYYHNHKTCKIKKNAVQRIKWDFLKVAIVIALFTNMGTVLEMYRLMCFPLEYIFLLR